jgi:adenosylhomocysteinase
VLNLVNNKGKFENKIYEIDRDQDLLIAGLKLEAMGIRIDKLSEVQNKYLSEYGEGT